MAPTYDEQEETPAESRLSLDYTIAPLNWIERPEPEAYYREGFELFKTIPDQPEKIRHVLGSYLEYVSGQLKEEIISFMAKGENR